MDELKVRQIVDDELLKGTVVYETLQEVPAWAQETVKKLVDKNYLRGDGSGLGLTSDLLRVLVINDRAGLYDR